MIADHTTIVDSITDIKNWLDANRLAAATNAEDVLPLKVKVERASKDLDELDDRLRDVRRNAATLQTQADILSYLLSLLTDIDTLENTLDTLEAADTALENRILAAEADTTANTNAITALLCLNDPMNDRCP